TPTRRRHSSRKRSSRSCISAATSTPSRDMAGRARPRGVVGLAALAVLSAIGVSWYRGGLGDYPHDAAGAVDALAGGHVLRALTVHPQPLMGPIAILARAPLVAAGHALARGTPASDRPGAIPGPCR